MKILHVTYHNGCKLNIDFIGQQLNHDVSTQIANWNYNIGKNLANHVWEKYKDYYNSFDCIITSDTAPLSRIFLQNNFSKKLIIWVCNRFDYYDHYGFNDLDKEKFPDKDYYDLFKEGITRKNVKVYSYTKFEHEYANFKCGIQWNEIIKPCAVAFEKSNKTAFPNGFDKHNSFLITKYHNDTIFMNLKEKCDSLGIPSYCGQYYGPNDLEGIKGIIHIPYAWSNLALFENWSLGIVYFIPSKSFLLKIMKDGPFFWSPPFPTQYIESSEWYLPEHKDLFVYFDSWEHLKSLTTKNDIISEKKNKILEFVKNHNASCIDKWVKALE